MAFGKIDHVINHITGERKQITTIDIDREFGRKSSKFSTKNSCNKKDHETLRWLEEYRQQRIDSILSIATIPQIFLTDESYSTYIILDEKDKIYKWNESLIRELTGDVLYNVYLLSHKRIDSNYEFYYINKDGSYTNYKDESYYPLQNSRY